MKQITKKSVPLGLALLIVLGLAVSSRIHLTDVRKQAAEEQAALAALSAQLSEKQAALQSLIQSGLDIQSAVDSTSVHLQQKQQDVSALEQEIGDIQEEIQDIQQQISVISKEKSYHLEVYDALQEGYERVIALLNSN